MQESSFASAGQPSPADVTRLLDAWDRGERGALDQLIPLVVDDLRRIARRQLARERPGHTLQPTELIHEVYLRWSERRDRQDGSWRDRAQFFALAATQIRHILVDHARRRNADKRGDGKAAIRLTDAGELAAGRTDGDVDLIDLDRALETLQTMDADYARIVELRYFGGLSAREVAEVMGITERTVMRHWSWIKAWLHRQLVGGPRQSGIQESGTQGKESRRHDDERLEAREGALRGGARAADG